MISHSIPHHALAMRATLALALAAALPAARAADVSTATFPDSGLFTTYSIGPNDQSVNWLVCGSTQQTEGCYDLGTLGAFGQVTAMIEGAPRFDATKGTVTREIYVCDVAAGSGADVTVYDYTKTDKVSATDDAATVVLRKAIPTTLVGGANAACQMAASPSQVYVMVNGGLAGISKSGASLSYGQASAGVSSVTADDQGFVITDYSDDQFGDSAGFSGGGNYFKVGAAVGTSLDSVPMFYGSSPANRMHVVPKARGAASAATSQAALDAHLSTEYSVFSAGSISFDICGSTQQSEGCYGGGGFGPFKHAGSIIEGYRVGNGDTITRHVYVCDDAAGGGAGVTLYDYLRTDVISSSYDQTTVQLARQLPLPLVGGAGANCSMSGERGRLFVGTRNGAKAVTVSESDYRITPVSGLNRGLSFATATADDYGFAATTFGSFHGSSDVNVFGHSPRPVQSTGGAYFLLNTANAVQTTSMPTSAAAVSDSLMGVRFKKPAR